MAGRKTPWVGQSVLAGSTGRSHTSTGAPAVGRSSTAFQVVDVIWLAMSLLATTLLARRIGGPWAGFAAASLVGAVPMLVVNARRAWIHVPETALVLVAVLAALWDLGLTRRRTVVALAVLGGLTDVTAKTDDVSSA